MCDDKSPVLPLRDLRPICDGRPPHPKGDHSLVSQKGSNYFLRIDPNNTSAAADWERTQIGTTIMDESGYRDPSPNPGHTFHVVQIILSEV